MHPRVYPIADPHIRIQRLQVLRDTLLARYGQEHPLVVRVDQQLAKALTEGEQS